MSKKKTNNADEHQSLSDELLLNGTLTLTAESRQEIYDQGKALVEGLPVSIKWTRSIVTHDNNGHFEQTYSILKD